MKPLSGLFLLLVLPWLARAGVKEGTLDVYWIDSEGGGSTLVVTPAGESVLIDAGHLGTRDAGWLISGMKEAGLTKLDYLVITHFHSDHYGAAAELAKTFPIGAIYERAIPTKDPDGKAKSNYASEIKEYREIRAKRVPLKPGVTVPLKQASGASAPRLTLTCLGADQKFIAPTAAMARNPAPTGRKPVEIPPSDDDNSAVFLLQLGQFRFFDGGDLTWNLEEKLVSPVNLVGKVDVYQVDHHGLDSSNNPFFLQSLAPEVAVMNNGPRKGGRAGSLAALHGTKSIRGLYQVHKSLIVPETENAPDEYIANLAEGKPVEACTANFIKMIVAPDAKSYTVSIPANGHARKYETVAK